MSKKPGLTLADLAAMSEDVPVGKSYITVKAISARNALSIFKRYPKLLKMVNGFDLATFLDVAPEAAAAVIAAGTGHLENAKAEKDAENISLEVQYDLLEAIGRLTFKSGFAPFVEKILRMAGGVVPQFENSGKATATNSPKPSKPSSPPDTPLT